MCYTLILALALALALQCPAGCVSGFVANGGCELMMAGDVDEASVRFEAPDMRRPSFSDSCADSEHSRLQPPPPPDEYQIMAVIPKGLDCMNEAYGDSCGNEAGMTCVAYLGAMPPMDYDGTYGAGPPPMDMYYGSGQGMGSGPPMPDCPICIEGFKSAGGCGLLEDLVSGVTSDDMALNAAIPAGCEEAGDDCGADALAECGFDPAMFDDMEADDDWGEVGCRCRYASFHDRGCAGAVFYSTRLYCTASTD